MHHFSAWVIRCVLNFLQLVLSQIPIVIQKVLRSVCAANVHVHLPAHVHAVQTLNHIMIVNLAAAALVQIAVLAAATIQLPPIQAIPAILIVIRNIFLPAGNNHKIIIISIHLELLVTQMFHIY